MVLAILLAGAGLVLAGCAMLSLPVTLIVGGALLLAAGVDLTRGRGE